MHKLGRPNASLTLFICIAALIVVMFGPVNGFGSDVSEVTLTMDCRIKSKGDTARISLTCLIPQSIDNRQKVYDINYSTAPVRVFDDGDNHYAIFDIAGPAKEEKIVITAKMGLMGHSLTSNLTLRKEALNPKNSILTPEERSRYLISERFIQSGHPDIERAAKSIKDPYYLATPKPASQQLDVVKKIYRYVVRTMGYAGYNPVDRGAVEALKTKRGDCTEYSDLFVALCRAKGLPARTAEGLTTEYSSTPKHSWAEVFISGLGWIPFDPTFADFKAASFEKMKPIYIYLSRIRNDKNLDNFHFYYYRYWGTQPKVKMAYKFRK